MESFPEVIGHLTALREDLLEAELDLRNEETRLKCLKKHNHQLIEDIHKGRSHLEKLRIQEDSVRSRNQMVETFVQTKKKSNE